MKPTTEQLQKRQTAFACFTRKIAERPVHHNGGPTESSMNSLVWMTGIVLQGILANPKTKIPEELGDGQYWKAYEDLCGQAATIAWSTISAAAEAMIDFKVEGHTH